MWLKATACNAGRDGFPSGAWEPEKKRRMGPEDQPESPQVTDIEMQLA